MPDESQIPPQGGDGPNPDNEATQTGGAGPGAGEAGLVGITLLALYLIVFTLFVIYALVKIWPVPTPSRENPPTATASPSPSPSAKPSPSATTLPTPTASATQPQAAASVATQSPTASPTPSPSPSVQPPKVSILSWEFELWDEQRLLLLVILGGALGTLVHCLRSVYWYIGNRSLIKSWIAMYFMMPFAGAALSLVFYLVVRGGFFSPQSSFQQTSPFGFAAFSALIGMFSSQAVLKLKDVAEVLLSKPQGGANAKPQQTVTPPVGGTSPSAPPVPETPKVGGDQSGKG
jgi:hypothetical protein